MCVFSITVQAEETGTNGSIRPNIKAQIENRKENNKEVRTNILERRELKKEVRSEVKEMRAEIKDMRAETKQEIKAMRASSTEMFKRTNGEVRKDIAKKMELRAFETRKNALVKELNFSLTNLSSIVIRIEARITKVESEGRDMTEAKALLVTAKEKIEKAKTDVAAFQALNITPITNGTSTNPSEIELTKPRVLGDTAIKSVKEARDALQKVVVAIAHAMGVKSETNPSSETNSTN